MNKILGIINFEQNDVQLEGISEFRPFSSITFLGRYRLIDFILSNLSNSGVKNFQIYVKEKPRSVFEHVGIGSQYNINSKQGKMRIMYGEQPSISPIYNTDITAFLENLQWIEEDKAETVVIAPSHFVYTQDFSDVIKQHQERGSDITVLYKNTDEAKSEFAGCTTLTLDKNKRVIATDVNRGQAMHRSISLDAFIMSKELFIKLIKQAHTISSIYWLKEMIFDNVMDLVVDGYSVRSEVFAITNLDAYYRAQMRLIGTHKSSLFKEGWPIYTRTSDSPPTMYSRKAEVSTSLIANGVIIEGKVVNSIIGRGCQIAPGAVVKNSIILPNSIIGVGVHVDYAIIDKHVKAHRIKEIKGTPDHLVYIKRRDSI